MRQHHGPQRVQGMKHAQIVRVLQLAPVVHVIQQHNIVVLQAIMAAVQTVHQGALNVHNGQVFIQILVKRHWRVAQVPLAQQQ